MQIRKTWLQIVVAMLSFCLCITLFLVINIKKSWNREFYWNFYVNGNPLENFYVIFVIFAIKKEVKIKIIKNVSILIFTKMNCLNFKNLVKAMQKIIYSCIGFLNTLYKSVFRLREFYVLYAKPTALENHFM